MKRREFVGWCGVGAIANSLPMAIVACSPNQSDDSSMAPSNPPRADGFQVVGTLTELQQQGVLRVQNFVSGPLLVVANPKDGNTVLAVDPTCTHQGCPVDWKSDSAAFTCPCHGSRFEPGGAVVNGPAVRPLSTYPTLVEGDQILVQTT